LEFSRNLRFRSSKLGGICLAADHADIIGLLDWYTRKINGPQFSALHAGSIAYSHERRPLQGF
jgi:hypothetical protein